MRPTTIMKMAVITFLMTLVALGFFQSTVAAESACPSLQGGAKAACNACETDGGTFSSFKCVKAAVKAAPAVEAAAPKPKKVAKAAPVKAKAPVEIACDLSKKPGKGKKCTSCTDANASVLEGMCACKSGHDVRDGICVAMLACISPQVPVNGDCGCEDLLAKGPQCKCIEGAVRMTVGEETFCAKFDPKYATLDDDPSCHWLLWLLAIVGAIAGLLALLLILVGNQKRDKLDAAKAKVELTKKELVVLEGKLYHVSHFLESQQNLVEQIKKARSRLATIVGMNDIPDEALTKATNEVESIESANKAIVDEMAVQKALPEKIKAAKAALKTAEEELSAIIIGKKPAAPTAKKEEDPKEAKA